MLNQDTLLLVQASLTLLTTALLISAALYADSPKEQRLWALGNVWACLGLALGVLTWLPALVHAVLSYGLMGLGLAVVLKGLRLFCMRDLSLGWVIGVTLLSLALPAYFTVVEPSLSGRLVVTGFYFGALNLVCAYTLCRHSLMRECTVSVIGFAVLGLALIMRGGYLLTNPQHGDDINNTVMNGSLFLISLAQVCIAFGLVLMVMRRHAKRLKHLSATDTLTGAFNRAGLELKGQRIMQRAKLGHRSVAIVMIDADHFKQINDSYGHLVGDEVLRHLAELLFDQMRPSDLLARYGGEEFVLLFDGINLAGAMKVSERLRHMVEQTTLTVEGHTVHYTISMGVACSDDHGYDLARLIAEGDAAMYAAKAAGRNHVATS